MQIILLLSIIVGMSLQSVLKKAYNNKITLGGAFFFSAITCLAAALFFVVSSGFHLEFTTALLPYAIGFGIGYGAATIFGFLAIQTGSLSLSSLVISYSLIVPTVYGLFFLDEKASAWFYIGLVFLCASLFLINMQFGKDKKGDGAKITWKWLLFLLLAFLGNGACSTVQVVQQRNFNGAYKNELMIIALALVTVTLLIFAFVRERNIISETFKGGWHFMTLCGVANGAVNLFVMLLANRMNASLMYPLISAGGIILTALISIFFYKEKLSKSQITGLILGIAAVVFMNI